MASTITTQGYYFWNGIIFVLAEGISTEQDGGSPQPIGKAIWMEGFPPDEFGQAARRAKQQLCVGAWSRSPADFKSGGNFGKDGKYTEFLQVTSAGDREHQEVERLKRRKQFRTFS